jgi:hypothetical protein
MIKFTRLPNPTNAVIDQQFKVSGVVDYCGVQAMETGYEIFFGENSKSYNDFKGSVESACLEEPLPPTEELKYTQADLDAMKGYADNLQHKYDTATSAFNAADREVQRLRSEVTRMDGALASEGKRHDETQKHLNELTREYKELMSSYDDLARTCEVNEGRSNKLNLLIQEIHRYATDRSQYRSEWVAIDLYSILKDFE